MVLLIAVILVCSLIIIFYIFSQWRYSYWKRKDISQLDPELYYGDLRSLLTGKISVGEAFKNLYSTFKKQNLKYGGVYWVLNPVFIPVDIKIVKDILQADFPHFHSRGLYTHKSDNLTHQLFRMEGEEWKQLRAKLTPTFTSAKMKMMFDTLLEKNQGLIKVADQCAQHGEIIEVRDVAGLYTIDVIVSCAFGIECNALRDGDSEFKSIGKKITSTSIFKQWVENIVPWKLLGYTGYRCFPGIENFFSSMVKNTIEQREKNNIYRKDFMHLLIQLRNRGILTDDGKLTRDINEKGILTEDEIIAQCFLFFVAGFDTSSNTMAYALYELAKHPEIQDKVREEIRQVIKKYDGKLTYEGVKELELTEKVILETLRKYPIVPTIPRICTKTYKIPGTDIILEKGTLVQISCWGIHMDPEYYPNPEVWDPERFSKEEKAKRPELAYFPFGEGPRICIGARFGMMQTKIGLVGLLKEYRYAFCKNTPDPITFIEGQLLLHPKENMWLNITKVSQ